MSEKEEELDGMSKRESIDEEERERNCLYASYKKKKSVYRSEK